MFFEKFIARFKRKKNSKGQASHFLIEEESDDWSGDPNNPFPDVVTIEFSDVLDLHSIPPRQVRAVVEDFIDEAHRRRVRWVRIIHGKGIGVQREIVRSILSRTPFVIEFRDAPPEAGGWGATLVTLDDKGPADQIRG